MRTGDATGGRVRAGADPRLAVLSGAATLTDALAEWAVAAPAKVAVVDADRLLTYGELWHAIESLTRTLRAEGVGTGCVVALQLPRGWRQIVAAAGVLAAGAAFVPVDPAYPVARQQYILDDSAATVVVEERDGDFAVRRTGSVSTVRVPPGAAYVLYTSGSTGDPKGVVVGHDHVLALLRSCFSLIDVGDRDSWTLVHSFSFDFSVWEVWGCLLSGGRLVLVPAETVIEPDAFVALLAREGITVLNLVPSVFRVVVDHAILAAVDLPQLRYVILGGEAINAEAVNRWAHAGIAPSSLVVNMYGITETTVHVTFAPLDAPVRCPDGATPIGRPLPHLQVRLVDEQLQPVPPRSAGEILVSGASLAFGYWRRPELTADRFITRDGIRWYRSGDKAYADPDGYLYYIGRNDDQVKVRGHRIELGEVEAALRRHPAVADAACAVERGPAANDLLVAYVVASAAGRARPGAELRAAVLSHLRAALPRHEVPTILRLRDSLPLTVTGKIDRAHLTDAS